MKIDTLLLLLALLFFCCFAFEVEAKDENEIQYITFYSLEDKKEIKIKCRMTIDYIRYLENNRLLKLTDGYVSLNRVEFTGYTYKTYYRFKGILLTGIRLSTDYPDEDYGFHKEIFNSLKQHLQKTYNLNTPDYTANNFNLIWSTRYFNIRLILVDSTFFTRPKGLTKLFPNLPKYSVSVEFKCKDKKKHYYWL